MRIAVSVFLIFFVSTASFGEVYVEPTRMLIDNSVDVPYGKVVPYEMTLNTGDRIVAEFNVAGGVDNEIKIWLLDLENYQRMRAGQTFNHPTGAGGSVTEHGAFDAVIPRTSIWYLVLDNSSSTFYNRTVSTSAHVVGGAPTAESESAKEFYSLLYNDVLKQLFIFEDFDIHIGRCGVANAFSSPDIRICEELNRLLSDQGVSKAATFVFMHEAAHSLLNVWDYPLYQNEDAADELATALLILMQSKDAAMDAARWWGREMSQEQALSKLWHDDRHTVSPQRARNIINWINDEEELMSRWLHLLIPKMTDYALDAAVADFGPEPDRSDRHYLSIDHELVKRQAIARGESALASQ